MLIRILMTLASNWSFVPTGEDKNTNLTSQSVSSEVRRNRVAVVKLQSVYMLQFSLVDTLFIPKEIRVSQGEGEVSLCCACVEEVWEVGHRSKKKEVWACVRRQSLFSHLLSTICQFTTSPSVSLIPLISRMCSRRTHGSEFAYGANILPPSLFFIDHNLCVGSGVRTFPAKFDAYATFINETPELLISFCSFVFFWLIEWWIIDWLIDCI